MDRLVPLGVHPPSVFERRSAWQRTLRACERLGGFSEYVRIVVDEASSVQRDRLQEPNVWIALRAKLGELRRPDCQIRAPRADRDATEQRFVGRIQREGTAEFAVRVDALGRDFDGDVGAAVGVGIDPRQPSLLPRDVPGAD